jgi:hypothetical protein
MKPGDKVHFIPDENSRRNLNGFEMVDFGIVKEVRDDAIFVVFHCGRNWDDYWKYTGAMCNASCVFPGWEAVNVTNAVYNSGIKVERHIIFDGVAKHYHSLAGPAYIEHNRSGIPITELYYINGQKYSRDDWEAEWLKIQAAHVGLDGLIGDKDW